MIGGSLELLSADNISGLDPGGGSYLVSGELVRSRECNRCDPGCFRRSLCLLRRCHRGSRYDQECGEELKKFALHDTTILPIYRGPRNF